MPRLLPAGDAAVLVDLAGEGGGAERVLALDAMLTASPVDGVVEWVPGMDGLLVVLDPLHTTPAAVEAALRGLLDAPPAPAPRRGRTLTLPVRFGGAGGPDIEAVAARCGVDVAALIDAVTAAEHRVVMVGNLPGLPYLAGLPDHLAVPRRHDPRPRVPAGSVGLAAGMLCVYPVEGPGGWHLVGRTPVRLFDAAASPPAMLRPGDRVRITAIDDADDGGLDPGPSTTPAAARPAAAARLTVVRPGLGTTVQDLGRPGYQRDGVPPSGALDTEALRVANLLVGNPAGAAGLEVTHDGPVLRLEAGVLDAAVVGAATVTVERDGRTVDLGGWRAVRLRPGDVLSVGRVTDGLRCCVALQGGIAVEPVLGSRSTYPRALLGGLEGRTLRAGDVLPAGPPRRGDGLHTRAPVALEPPGWWDPGGPFRLVRGPRAEMLGAASWDALLGDQGFTVSPRSDRVGLRLEGPHLSMRGADRFVSEPCPVGALQVTAGGLPIVLGADRGTTGGYPVVATVAGVDLARLARLRPGDRVRFAVVDRDGAVALRRERERLLEGLAAALHPAPPP